MNLLQVETEAHVARLALVITFAALVVVTAVNILFYPPEDWARELGISWPLTTLLAYGFTRRVAAQTLKIHHLNEELMRLVSRDKLTDVGTRDYFFAQLDERPGVSGVTLMIDIDHFKLVNDTYGHLTGDVAIAHVARIIAESVGTRDIVCRFGGEEFVVFLENATQTIAREVAERIRTRIEKTPIHHDEVVVPLTVSLGGSPWHSVPEIEEAINIADKALYVAKQTGRNKAIMSGDAMPHSEDWKAA